MVLVLVLGLALVAAAPCAAATRHVNAGDNLPAVLNAAQPGNELVLQAGARFRRELPPPGKDRWPGDYDPSAAFPESRQNLGRLRVPSCPVTPHRAPHPSASANPVRSVKGSERQRVWKPSAHSPDFVMPCATNLRDHRAGQPEAPVKATVPDPVRKPLARKALMEDVATCKLRLREGCACGPTVAPCIPVADMRGASPSPGRPRRPPCRFLRPGDTISLEVEFLNLI